MSCMSWSHCSALHTEEEPIPEPCCGIFTSCSCYRWQMHALICSSAFLGLLFHMHPHIQIFYALPRPVLQIRCVGAVAQQFVLLCKASEPTLHTLHNAGPHLHVEGKALPTCTHCHCSKVMAPSEWAPAHLSKHCWTASSLRVHHI